MRSMVEPGSQAEQVGRLILAVVLVLVMPSLPFGNYLIYPFMILTTWFHEMGHGLAALAMGQDFNQLIIYPNGSGVAESALDGEAGAITRATIAAGGPLMPSVIGAALILASAKESLWRPAVYALSVAIIASVAIYVRSTVGIAVLPLVAVGLALVAWKTPPGFVRFTLQFLGVLAAMSMLRDFDYLFTEEIVLGGQTMLSDTGAIEEALFLPHWFWAGAILLTSAVMVGASLKYALGKKPAPRRPLPANVMQFRGPRR